MLTMNNSAWNLGCGSFQGAQFSTEIQNLSALMSAAPPASVSQFSHYVGNDSTISAAQFYAGKIVEKSSQLDSSAYKAARSQISQIQERYAIEWKRLLLDPKSENSANALADTVRPVVQALLELGAGSVNLRDLPVDRVNGVHLAVILRATLRRKASVPGWDDALDVARAALARDQLDEQVVLSGLIAKG